MTSKRKLKARIVSLQSDFAAANTYISALQRRNPSQPIIEYPNPDQNALDFLTGQHD